MIIIENTYSEQEPANAYLLHNPVQVPGMGDVIAVRDLVKKYYGRVEVLGNLIFSVEAEDFAAVCGKPESGKTRLLNSLDVLGRKTSARVPAAGDDIVGGLEGKATRNKSGGEAQRAEVARAMVAEPSANGHD